jgi:hypothetical protein
MSVKRTVTRTVEITDGRSMPASSRMIAICSSICMPDRPWSTWTVAFGIRDATYSASSFSARASASPTISAVGVRTLGRMSRTSVCHRIRVRVSATSGLNVLRVTRA